MRIFFLSLSLLALVSQAVWATSTSENTEQAALNQQYRQFKAAFAALDTRLLGGVYADDATYIPEQQNVEIVQGKDNVLALYQKFFDRIKKKKARIEVDFRLVQRDLQGAVATDICYYVVRFHPPADTEEPVSEFAGKMVTVSERNAAGQWHWKVDISNRADPKYFFDATPKPNLYYGSQFLPLNR